MKLAGRHEVRGQIAGCWLGEGGRGWGGMVPVGGVNGTGRMVDG